MPLIILLPSSHHSDVKVRLIEVVKLVLEKTELRQVHALKTILIVLAKEIYNFQSAHLVDNISEELTISVVSCIAVANRRASSDSVEQFFRPENASQVTQIMYLLLLLLDKSDCREVRLASLDALMSLLHVDEASDQDDIVLRHQMAGIIFFAVPMIWSSLSRLILKDAKIGRRVIAQSLVALGRILCLIMEDDKEENGGHHGQKPLTSTDFAALISSSSRPTPSDPSSILNDKQAKKQRTPEWLRAAGGKLREPLKSLISLTGNESPTIRRAVGLCCELWLRRCRVALVDNLDTFTEILLILSEDEDEELAQYFALVLRELKGEANSAFVSVNRQLIERHLSRLPRIVHRQSEKEQWTALALLKAHFKALEEEELILLLSDSKALDVFVMNLLLLVQFNYDNAELLKEEHTLREYVDTDADMAVGVSNRPWEDFKYFNGKSSKIPLLLQGTLKSVRGRTGTRILIEYLMRLLRDRPGNCAEVLKIVQLVIGACLVGDERADVEIFEKLLDELLDERYWNLSYQTVRNGDRTAGQEHLRVSEHTEGLYESSLSIKHVDLSGKDEEREEYLVSPAEAKANVLVSCVLMETVAASGRQLGAERFQRYVFRVLFNLLSSAGNSNFCIHSAGLNALAQITRLYRMAGIRELIMANSDYVMFFVNQSLRDATRSRAALDVISVILEFCSRDVLGYVELIVNRLLEECSKYHRMGNLAAYLKIFGLFLKNLGREGEPVEELKNVDEVYESWLAILNPPPEDDFELERGEDDPMPEASQVKKEPPKDVEIAQQIMQVALKHISSKNVSEVVAAMETLTWGVAILKQHEDELLPLVHQIWAPLSLRFSDKSPVVLRNAFKMLLTLADAAKDFIHRRTVDEVVPVLNRILKSSWSSLAKAGECGGRYRRRIIQVQVEE